MRINNVFSIGQNVTLTIPVDADENTIKIFYYIDGTSKRVINIDSIDIQGDFKHVYFKAPYVDSVVIAKYMDTVEFLRVGNPPVYMLLHYITNEPIEYQQFDYNGRLLKSGIMTDLGDDIYVCNNISIIKSFYYVAGGIITLTLPEKYLSSSIGKIRLERGNWQLIAMPIAGKVSDAFVAKLAEQEGVLGTDLIEICSAYPGHINKFLSYIPGFTNPASEHNFELTYDDNGTKEITAFWVKCKNWTHKTTDIVFEWNI